MSSVEPSGGRCDSQRHTACECNTGARRQQSAVLARDEQQQSHGSLIACQHSFRVQARFVGSWIAALGCFTNNCCGGDNTTVCHNFNGRTEQDHQQSVGAGQREAHCIAAAVRGFLRRSLYDEFTEAGPWRCAASPPPRCDEHDRSRFTNAARGLGFTRFLFHQLSLCGHPAAAIVVFQGERPSSVFFVAAEDTGPNTQANSCHRRATSRQLVIQTIQSFHLLLCHEQSLLVPSAVRCCSLRLHILQQG
jgi:hypothetical protein